MSLWAVMYLDSRFTFDATTKQFVNATRMRSALPKYHHENIDFVDSLTLLTLHGGRTDLATWRN
jgi:hypothetical protein